MTVKDNIRPRQGFALIVTVSLMILLALIAVGLMSLSSVTLRSSARDQASNHARANARLALSMAMAQLQEHLGPDTRISMTANQRNPPGGDGNQGSAVAGNRHWTGVYDSWPAALEERPAPSFRSWLISGPPALTAAPESADQTLAGTSAVELVAAGTLGPSAVPQHVRVPALEVESRNGQPGRIAWWTGDQGVKAAIGTRTAAEPATRELARDQMQAAPRNAIELPQSNGTAPFADLDAADPRLDRVTSWQQVAHLAPNPGVTRPLFHDLAAYSTGLLTNVRRGGFRQDLSMKMETYTGAPDPSLPENVLYTATSEMTGNEEIGINFMELWAYYQLYRQLQYGGGLSYTTGGPMAQTTPFLRTGNSLDAVVRDDWDNFKQPLTVNFQIVLSFEQGPLPDSPGEQALYLNMDPVVTLWNPLDVAVDIPTVDDRNRCYMYVFWVIPYDINVTLNGRGLQRCSLMRSVYGRTEATGGIDYNMLRLNVGSAERLTLRPGEVLMVSQTGNTVAGNGGFRGLDGRKGFNFGGGTRFPLVDENGNYVRLNPSGNDQINYSLAPNNLTGGRDGPSGGNIVEGFSQNNSRRWSTTHNSVVVGNPWGQNTHIGLVSIDHCYGRTRAQPGETRTTNNPRRTKTLANSERVFANAPRLSTIYPVISGPQQTRTIPAAALAANKAPFMIHYYHIKTEEQNRRGNRMMARFNPKAHNVDFYDMSEIERDLLPYETGVKPVTSWQNTDLELLPNGQAYFGSSYNARSGSNLVNTHSVPRRPILSLAALQHSFANGFNRLRASQRTEHANSRLPLLPQVSHAIGNSLAPSLIQADQTTANLPNYPHPLADHSFLANRALWDDYFFSGITPQQQPAFPVNRSQREFAEAVFRDGEPLPVARYLAQPGEVDDERLGEWFSGIRPTETAVRGVASHLRVDGLFNVNSTSVEAWKAVLGALKDRPVVARNSRGLETLLPAAENTPVANLHSPTSNLLEDQAAPSPDQWSGRRVLTDPEIENLANGIVREVRRRGPFLSLADFVNRRVGRNTELARAGAIQSALDSDEVTINENQNQGRTVASAAANRLPFPDAEQGTIHYGAPSLVKQADILTPIAPVLSARSDSFIIRCYGESLNRSGEVEARAWCEAVVERGRDYVDPGEPPETLPETLNEEVNRRFGRRFNLVSFRWLHPDEI